MKKNYYNIVTILALFFCITLSAQSVQKNHINYQGVARDSENNIMEQESISVGIAVKFGSANATPAYKEDHSVTTDANGVFNLKIGNGNPVSGSYEGLPWGDAAFMTVSLNGVEIGTTGIMAVPYAIASGDKQWEVNGPDIENKNTGEVSIKTNLRVDGGFNLSTGNQVNEISDDGALSENSNGILPTQRAVKTYVDNKAFGGAGGAQIAAEVSFDNTTSGLAATNTQAAIDELVFGGGGADGDTDSTNEFQNLSLSGTTLQISDGTGVDLSPIIPPGGTDDQLAVEVLYDNTVSGLTAVDAQAAIDELVSGGLTDTDDQGLVLTGDLLTIEDGTGSIDLSAYGDDADADPTNEIDVTTKTGILLGDGTAVTGLVGTADGDVAKWDTLSSTWVAATDEVGGGGSGTPTGLEALDEGNDIGWRLIGRDPDDYGNIGENAVDLSYFNENLPNGGATGAFAFAAGDNTRALGNWSTAMGRQTSAEGEVSFATGFQNIALGNYATVMGRETQAVGSTAVAMNSETSAIGDAATSMGFATRANGRATVAMGINTFADANSSLAIGRFNIGGGDGTNWVDTDPIFEIGIGSNISSRANAMTVLKNGNIGIGEASPTAKLDVDGNIRSSNLTGAGERNVVADANGNLIIGASGGGGTPTGLEALDEGNGIGWRLIGREPGRFGNIGLDATDLSSGDPGSTTHGASGEASTAMGQGTTASREWSTAMGYYTISSNAGSTAMGIETNASGQASLSSGDATSASGLAATAMGGSTAARGDYSTVMGLATRAEAYISTAIGRYNIGGGDEDSWQSNDPLFEIGNGTFSTRSNALTVLKNGNTGIGTNKPEAQFVINSSQERPFIIKSTKTNNYMQYVTPSGVIGYSGVWSGDNDVDFGTVEINGIGKVHLTTKATPRLTVTANGNVGIGTTDPTTKLHIKSNSTVGSPQITIQEDDNDYARLELTNSAVRFWHLAGYVGGTKADDRFNIFNSEEGNILSVHGNGNVFVNGAVAHSSDRRLKKNIITSPYGLETVMQLAPKAYYWKKDNANERRALGLIAQDVQPIINEVVHGGADEEDMLSISYSELVPVLIKAIQEQQSIIEDRSTKISDLETRLAKLEAKLW